MSRRQPGRRGRRPGLREAWRRVDSPAVADVDLDGAPWRHIDSAVAELITAVNRLTAARTGEPPRTAASNVPPVTGP